MARVVKEEYEKIGNIRTVTAERLVRRASPKSPNPLTVDEAMDPEQKESARKMAM